MDRVQLFNELKEIFVDVLDLDDVTLTDETVADDVEGWDSLSHITLISTIERKYNIKFNMKEIVNLQNVGEMINLILEKLG